MNSSIGCYLRCRIDRAPKIVTTDGEFHTFKRQTERLAEDDLIDIVAVPTEPFATCRRA